MEGGRARGGFCHKCGALSGPDLEFCTRCGTRLHLVASDETICWNCGTRTEAGPSAFCGTCGVPVGTGAAPTLPGTPGRGVPPSPPRTTAPGHPRPSPPRSGAWILVVLLFVALLVIAGLQVTGEGDRLLGRTYYIGAQPPPTNVTVLAVNVTEVLTLNSTGQSVVSQVTVVPPGAPLYAIGPHPFEVTLPLSDNVAQTQLTVRTITGGAGCRFVGATPSLPADVAAPTGIALVITLEATGGPGDYVLGLTVDETLS